MLTIGSIKAILSRANFIEVLIDGAAGHSIFLLFKYF